MTKRIGRRHFVACGLGSAMQFAVTASAFERASQSEDEKTSASLAERLASYLTTQQKEDGSWRSNQYGVLRSGQAMTPWVLLALLQSGSMSPRSKACDRAIAWIRTNTREGVLGIADPDVMEYPVYATSLAVRCLNFVLRDTEESRELIECRKSMVDYLLREQFNAQRGFRESDLAFGGWGFGGKHPPRKTGHMDLAHTRLALQALRAADIEVPKYATDASVLLGLLQKHPSDKRVQPIQAGENSSGTRFDGGFYFSPIVLKANKGRVERAEGTAYFRSYATATCDGVLAMLAANLSVTHPNVQAAARWLARHPDWEYPFGIPQDHPEPWGDAVYFYHQAVRAEAYQALDVAGDWRTELVDRLASQMNDDGSVVNRRCALMKEDDPLLSTTLALLATNATRADAI